MAVKIDESVVRASALIGFRLILNLPINSAAMCWQSAALPPFPIKKIVPLLLIGL